MYLFAVVGRLQLCLRTAAVFEAFCALDVLYMLLVAALLLAPPQLQRCHCELLSPPEVPRLQVCMTVKVTGAKSRHQHIQQQADYDEAEQPLLPH